MEHPEKERGLINFAAVEKNDLPDFRADGWVIINETADSGISEDAAWLQSCQK